MIARFTTLPSGRVVLDTGRVQIGLRYEPPAPWQGSQADVIQRVMTAEIAREWHPTPRAFYVSQSWWRRALRMVGL